MTRTLANDGQLALYSPEVLYDPRFLEDHAGNRILHDERTAIVELIANAWDGGATEVRIAWPDGTPSRSLSIKDNGVGMTHQEFDRRWRTLSYNRLEEQGPDVVFPSDSAVTRPRRQAFGRNGIGRWAGFCFSSAYTVDTRASGLRNQYRVARGQRTPFEITRLVADEPREDHGTTIQCSPVRELALTPDTARAEIGMRFLTDPDFRVFLNGQPIVFEDISASNIERLLLEVGGGQTVELIVIDTQNTDRTTKQHGVAWHVGGRLVGSCSWRGVGADDLIDGRRIAAKRFTFIVRADFLADLGAVRRDWSGFDRDNEGFQRAAEAVHSKVREYLLTISEDDRNATVARARERNRGTLETLGPLEREKWELFVRSAQESCPSIRENDIMKLSEVVANLELAHSGYALIHKLGEYGPDRLDELYRLLEDWTLDMAKAVLDEIGKRLKLVAELELRVRSSKANEVQDLQPLFEAGLWIFGPEFETIEYTSNQGMTRVVQELFGRKDLTGSRNRPDFVVLPDGSVGLYSYPTYDEGNGEVGVASLVVVELKSPGVAIGEVQKNQCWKYLKELYTKGLLQDRLTRVRCFVVGSKLDPLERSPREEMDGTVEIVPMLFDTVLKRAESRLLNLQKRVKDAPFLSEHRDEIERFLAPPSVSPTLFK